MAMVKAYFDDSLSDGRVWAVGGYAGHNLQWEEFETGWHAVLEKHAVPYLHMKEFQAQSGIYAKWYPAKAHAAELEAFFVDLTSILTKCWLRPFWSITRLDELARFNAETGLSLQPYSLAVYACTLCMAFDYGGDVTIEAVFDHIEKVHSKLDIARSYIDNDQLYGKSLRNIALTPLEKTATFREFCPLQAADFIIWELRKNHLKLDEWFKTPNKPTEELRRSRHFDEWSKANFGLERPPARKTLEAIIASGAPPNGFVWDYDNLMQAHRFRCARWT